MPSKSIPINHWKINAFYNQTFNATMELLKQSRVPSYYKTFSKLL